MFSEQRHLGHIKTLERLALHELIPDVAWVIDLDPQGW